MGKFPMRVLRAPGSVSNTTAGVRWTWSCDMGRGEAAPTPSQCIAGKCTSPGQEIPLAYSHGTNNENTNYISLIYQRDDSRR